MRSGLNGETSFIPVRARRATYRVFLGPSEPRVESRHQAGPSDVERSMTDLPASQLALTPFANGTSCPLDNFRTPGQIRRIRSMRFRGSIHGRAKHMR